MAIPSSVIQPVVTASEMRAAEQAAFAAGQDSFALMTSAGAAVADAIKLAHPAGNRSALILCGPGNNGGDGFIVADLLSRSGWRVCVAAMRSRTAYKGDAGRAAAAWTGDWVDCDPAHLAPLLDAADILVDALFGIGLDRPPQGDAALVVDLVNRSTAEIWAVDIPSGISADTGHVPGSAIRAAHTVTFGWPKPGHLLLPAKAYVGALHVAPIGLTASVLPSGVSASVNQPALWLANLPRPGIQDHKYSRGHALVIGSSEMPGAGRLASLAARRIGVGMLSVAAPAATLPLFMADQPGIIARAAARSEDYVEILMDRRISGVLVGSGLVPDASTREAVLTALAAGRATVVDGGGLTAFADRPEDLFTLGRADVVLTPHEGEFARLFPDLGADLGKLERVRAAARRSRAVVLLKGADTVVAHPDGSAAIMDEASSYLATAGSGDVLAGLILGMLAQGMKAYHAAAAGIWFHAQAGLAAGPGLIAEDLSGQIPPLLRRLGR